MKKYTNISIYVRYSENMDTWKMSEKSVKYYIKCIKS